MTRAKTTLLYAGLAYTVLVWGAAFPVAKAALAGGMHPVALVAWRFLLAAACLAPVALRRPGWRGGARPGIGLGALLALMYVLHTLGLGLTSASNSGFLTGAFVVFVPLFMWFYAGQGPRPAHYGAILLCLAGVWLVTGGVSGVNAGDCLTIASTLAYAAHIFATDRCVRRHGGIVILAFHQFWVAGLACLALAAAAGVPAWPADGQTAAAAIFLALFPTLSALLTQMAAQRELPPLTVAMVFSLEPLAAALFCWTIGGEPFRARAAWGGVLIVAAIAAAEAARAGNDGGAGEPAARHGRDAAASSGRSTRGQHAGNLRPTPAAYNSSSPRSTEAMGGAS